PSWSASASACRSPSTSSDACRRWRARQRGRWLVQHAGPIAILHQGQYLIAGSVPDALIEDLHLVITLVAGSLDERAHAVEVDAAVAHHAAPHEQIRRRDLP